MFVEHLQHAEHLREIRDDDPVGGGYDYVAHDRRQLAHTIITQTHAPRRCCRACPDLYPDQPPARDTAVHDNVAHARDRCRGGYVGVIQAGWQATELPFDAAP